MLEKPQKVCKIVATHKLQDIQAGVLENLLP